MEAKVACAKCGVAILTRTAEKTGGMCMPCATGIRANIEESRGRREQEASAPKPHEIVAGMVRARESNSDAEILAELVALPPLADEDDPCWNSEAYWNQAAFRYLALGDIAASRRLRGAIGPLLDRACHGDPGEIMRSLRHRLEAIVAPEWHILAEECLKAVESKRLGTVLWALDELSVLREPRARPHLERALGSESEHLRMYARIGLARLDGGSPTAD
jgi:hypothetical protein